MVSDFNIMGKELMQERKEADRLNGQAPNPLNTLIMPGGEQIKYNLWHALERFRKGEANEVKIYLGANAKTLSPNEVLFFSMLKLDEDGMARLGQQWAGLNNQDNNRLYSQISKMIEEGPGNAYLAAYYLMAAMKNKATVESALVLARKAIDKNVQRFGKEFQFIFGEVAPTTDMMNYELGKLSGTGHLFVSNVADTVEGKWYFLGFDSVVRAFKKCIGFYNGRPDTKGSMYQAKLEEAEKMLMEVEKASLEFRKAALTKDESKIEEMRNQFLIRYAEFMYSVKEAAEKYDDAKMKALWGTIMAAATPLVVWGGVWGRMQLVRAVRAGTAPVPVIRVTEHVLRQLTPMGMLKNLGYGVLFDSTLDQKKLVTAFGDWYAGNGKLKDVFKALGADWLEMTEFSILVGPILDRIIRIPFKGAGFVINRLAWGKLVTNYCNGRILDTSFEIAKMLRDAGLRNLQRKPALAELQKLASDPNLTENIVRATLKDYYNLDRKIADDIVKLVKANWKAMRSELKGKFGSVPSRVVRIFDKLFERMGAVPGLGPVGASWASLNYPAKIALMIGTPATAGALVWGISERNEIEEKREELVYELIGYNIEEARKMQTGNDKEGYTLDFRLVKERFNAPYTGDVYLYLAQEIMKAVQEIKKEEIMKAESGVVDNQIVTNPNQAVTNQVVKKMLKAASPQSRDRIYGLAEDYISKMRGE